MNLLFGNRLISSCCVICPTPVGFFWSSSKHIFTASAMGYIVSSLRDSQQENQSTIYIFKDLNFEI